LLAAAGAFGAAGETIMQIQGTTHRSPFAEDRVSGVHGIVTARTGSGFYVQDATGDGDPVTSDALLAFTRAAPSVAPGHETCSARSAAFHNLSFTELASPSILVHSSDHPAPPAAWIGGPGALPPTQIRGNAIASAWPARNSCSCRAQQISNRGRECSTDRRLPGRAPRG
jgi:hypothetical protein